MLLIGMLLLEIALYKKNSIEDMLSQAKATSKDKNLVVLLMHETNKYTPQYLDEIIRYYHNQGYEFRTIA